jgi:hypothetical protein
MSRWAETFATLSSGSDTLDTPRHSGELPSTMSDCVKSVTARPERASVPSWGESGAERAAIVECDGGIQRAWAEGFARLNPDHPLAGVPHRRWQRFIDDIGQFLDAGWAEKAVALSWGPLDLFGCDRQRPLARIDQQGLLWLLNGKKLVALTEDTATMQTQTGARQILRRKPAEPGQALPWDWPADEDALARVET